MNTNFSKITTQQHIGRCGMFNGRYSIPHGLFKAACYPVSPEREISEGQDMKPTATASPSKGMSTNILSKPEDTPATNLKTSSIKGFIEKVIKLIKCKKPSG